MNSYSKGLLWRKSLVLRKSQRESLLEMGQKGTPFICIYSGCATQSGGLPVPRVFLLMPSLRTQGPIICLLFLAFSYFGWYESL